MTAKEPSFFIGLVALGDFARDRPLPLAVRIGNGNTRKLCTRAPDFGIG